MRGLPLGKADFATIRKKGNYYADKTGLLYRLATDENPTFLSRPRRFGKTLLVSTLKYILQGRRDLFKGLWIDSSDYDWNPYPVLKLEMNVVGGNDVTTMNRNLSKRMVNLAILDDIVLMEDDTPSIMLETLLILLFKKYGQKVAVLIDEYDAPIIEHIHDSAKADEFRIALKRFFGVLKTYGEVIGHIFITGVSRFTKTSIFSELNNLRDITLESEFSSICGLTGTDLEDLLVELGDSTLKTLIGKQRMPHGRYH
jgi:hypothetical protein